MPASADRAIKSRGGAARYRTIKRDGRTMTCAVTRKAGPKGGKTVCWPRESAHRVVSRLLSEDDEPPMTRAEVERLLGSINADEAGHNLSFIQTLNQWVDNPVIRPDAEWVRRSFNQIKQLAQTDDAELLWGLYDDFSHFADHHA